MWRVRPLDTDHDTSTFSCGNLVLDDWLRHQAWRAMVQNTARTYVWTDGDDPSVVAYYAIAPTQVRRDGLSRSTSGGHSVIPAVLVARLALDRSLHGQGLGTCLLLDALDHLADAVDQVAGRLVVVDAIDDDAVRFYAHHGFHQIGDTRRLFLRSTSLRSVLDQYRNH
ncbi:MAG: GNAT family N-acetyltransferase [Cellulomonas sp.]|nr:GNAT family N-acetyltransferase [Cellulomonas sp.]